MADRPDREPGADAPRHAADPTRRRRVTIGHSARLGRGRRRRVEPLPGDQPGSEVSEPVDDEAAAPADQPPPQTDAATASATETAEKETTESETTQTETDVATEEPAATPVPGGLGGRQRLGSALSRPGRGQVIAAVLLVLFGFAVVTQIRLTTEDSTYANARREDLIQLLDGLTQENRRLEGELSDLERTRTNLQSGADAQQVAREEAERRIEVLSILAGTVPAEGQGIRMVISDPQNKVTAEMLLDAVEEMRDAGAEVIEINGSIRLVASSWFGTGPTGLVVDGKPVTKPITIEVIGDPHSLSEGANFRGGIVSEISSTKVGGTVTIFELENVEIDSLHTPKTNQYARPASAEPTR